MGFVSALYRQTTKEPFEEIPRNRKDEGCEEEQGLEDVWGFIMTEIMGYL
jgi:hypothetical protein